MEIGLIWPIAELHKQSCAIVCRVLRVVSDDRQPDRGQRGGPASLAVRSKFFSADGLLRNGQMTVVLGHGSLEYTAAECNDAKGTNRTSRYITGQLTSRGRASHQT